MYIESICKALNIKDEMELDQLLVLFEERNQNKSDQVKVSEESNDENEENRISNVKMNNLVIDPDIVLDILETYYKLKKNLAKKQSNLYILKSYITN
jgi:hypothetical protein